MFAVVGTNVSCRNASVKVRSVSLVTCPARHLRCANLTPTIATCDPVDDTDVEPRPHLERFDPDSALAR